VRSRSIVRIHGDLQLASGSGRISNVIRNQVHVDLLQQTGMSGSKSIADNIFCRPTDDGVRQSI
jgi:hypothetical protein